MALLLPATPSMASGTDRFRLLPDLVERAVFIHDHEVTAMACSSG